MNTQKNKTALESLKHCANCLFKASENIREMLDTYELDVDNPILKLTQLEDLNIFQTRLELMAQQIQRNIRKEVK